jgi:hypothetical protein
MNQGLRLKNNQRLLGAGIQHRFSTTLANINIPPQEAGLPQIDTSENTATIVLADHCEVAGLHVISSNGGFGILGGQASVNPTVPGITDALVQNNLISNVGNHGIVLNNCTGNLRIVDNIVSNISGTGVVVLNDDSLTIDSNIVIANNTISIASSGISIEHAGDGFIDFEIADNSAINMSSDAIGIRNRSTSSGNLCGSLLNNRTLAFAASAIKILATQASSTEIQIGNNVSLGSLNGFQAQTSDTAFLCLNLWNNTNQSHTLTQTNSSHFRLETSTGSIKGLQARNIGPFSTSGTIQYVIPGTCSCP